MRIKDSRIFRGLSQEELSANTGIDLDRLEEIESGDASVTDEEYAVLSDVLQVDGSYLSNTCEANYIAVMPVQYTFTNGMLAGYGEETQIVFPRNIDFYNTYVLISDGNYYIADTDFEKDGAFIVENNKGYYAASRENGKYFDGEGKEVEGKPVLRIIARTESLEDIMAGVIDDVRSGRYV